MQQAALPLSYAPVSYLLVSYLLVNSETELTAPLVNQNDLKRALPKTMLFRSVAQNDVPDNARCSNHC